MIYVLFDLDRNVVGCTTDFDTVEKFGHENAESRWDWNEDPYRAQQLANALTDLTGVFYDMIDSGAHTSPRYDIIRMPMVGDKVSYGFNGDAYPCGEIKSISKTYKVITTTTGERFYRRKNSDSWKRNGTWTMMQGHIDKRNPHF